MHTLFFSYSHVDEALRNELEKHLAALKHQKLIDTWHDRKIPAGTPLDDRISQELERADVILFLVSPDFLASNYCYNIEMKRALERHEHKEAWVIPVILRPCDWHHTPLGKLMATPTDGLPVVKHTTLDDGFLDVTKAIRAALGQIPEKKAPMETPQSQTAGVAAEPTWRSSNLRVKKQFTELEHDQFRDEVFESMANFFENSLRVLQERNPEIRTTYRRIDANTFTAQVYRNGKQVSACTIQLNGMFRGISFSQGVHERNPGVNDTLVVENDGHTLFLRSTMGMHNRSQGPMTVQGAAESYWDRIMEPLQSQ